MYEPVVFLVTIVIVPISKNKGELPCHGSSRRGDSLFHFCHWCDMPVLVVKSPRTTGSKITSYEADGHLLALSGYLLLN